MKSRSELASDSLLLEQATALEELLPRLMRKLFSMDPDHPATELPLAQLRVCSILQTGPRTISSLGDELGISVSAVTQIADRLERGGLVERTACGSDRRLRKLQLTGQGDSLMRSRREIRVERTADALSRLPEGERQGVMEALSALLDAAASSNALRSSDTLVPLVERLQVSG